MSSAAGGAKRAPAATFVIFGAMGDLTKRLLAPALVNLADDGLLDPETAILGVSRGEGSDDGLRDQLKSFAKDGAGWKAVSKTISYLQGDFADPKTFEDIKARVKGPMVFYLATAPEFFGPLVDSLGEAGLLDEGDGFRRVVVEKPFGSDLASAQALNRQILARASEAQVFRIDHFLGKETVQNIMVARFANTILEGSWNNRYIDHVQITAAETVDVGARGAFYDATGALRDMTPNHLFQLLALIAMEPPNTFDAHAIRAEKTKVITAVRPVSPDDAVRGRYAAGKIDGKAVTPYAKADNVAAKSRTETYVALKVELDTWRWTGTPFYLRTGKALSARDTEIVIQFKGVPLSLFESTKAKDIPPNRLVLQIQPNEGMDLGVVVKTPGPLVSTAEVSLDFRYADHFEIGGRTGYETLLYDVLIGDQTLFQSAEQIEAGWRAVQPLLDAWNKSGQPEDYAAGSAGPAAADELMARDGRAWHDLG